MKLGKVWKSRLHRRDGYMKHSNKADGGLTTPVGLFYTQCGCEEWRIPCKNCSPHGLQKMPLLLWKRPPRAVNSRSAIWLHQSQTFSDGIKSTAKGRWNSFDEWVPYDPWNWDCFCGDSMVFSPSRLLLKWFDLLAMVSGWIFYTIFVIIRLWKEIDNY